LRTGSRIDPFTTRTVTDRSPKEVAEPTPLRSNGASIAAKYPQTFAHSLTVGSKAESALRSRIFLANESQLDSIRFSR
jgi:hypothetical protein